MSEWISVKDRLPGCLISVLTTDGDRVAQTYRTSDDAGSWAAWRRNKVTHWMPLPDPPKESK
jgi:hypothetical protein